MITDLRGQLGARRWHFLCHPQAHVPGRLGTLPEDLDLAPQQLATVRQFVRDFRDQKTEGRGLLIQGDALDTRPLAGATVTWAVGAAMEYFNDVTTMSGVAVPIRCTSAGKYVNRLRASYNSTPEADDHRDFVAAMRCEYETGEAAKDLNVRLAVLLDLGEESVTEHSRNEIRSLLRLRYEHGLPTIVTTELADSDAVIELYGDPLAKLLSRTTNRVDLYEGT